MEWKRLELSPSSILPAVLPLLTLEEAYELGGESLEEPK
jgi:hypothetical protein